ncbi:hypothetical protein [Arthrobacter sp. OV608]|uniref:hypothetical protein n=1 Tax=Arthrobacter sp. OV608 TaxID=1882768 RepID=UPI00111436FC|nr:hypothetical protein [Arthrobacter sp. OV608]
MTMVVNPTVKPRVVTPGLVLASAGVLIALVLFLVVVIATELSSLWQVVVGGLLLAIALLVGALWRKRVNQRNTWLADATERWKSFDKAKLASGTTTEVTLLSVDAIQPTGSWVTIRWDRFDHVQSAWIEALPDPVWPGSVLLISPDRAQVMPGAPWPDTYYIRAADCLAWAPHDGRPVMLRAPSVVQPGYPSI